MSVAVFLLLLDFCSRPGSALIPGPDCNSPCYGVSLIPPVTTSAPALRTTVKCQNLIGLLQNSPALHVGASLVCLFVKIELINESESLSGAAESQEQTAGILQPLSPFREVLGERTQQI